MKQPPPPTPRPRRRTLLVLSGLAWPAGLILVGAATAIEAITLPVYLVLAAGYGSAVVLLLRAWGARRDRDAMVLTGIGPALFTLVGFGGVPTADEPGRYLLNTTVLLLVALALLVVAIRLLVRYRSSPAAAAAVPAVTLFALGSTLYVANLVARLAVVFSGAAGQQAAVEDRAWVAYAYLRGLEGSPSFMAYLLVWLDLLQLAYVVTAYLGFAGLATLLRQAGVVADGAGTGVARAARAAAGLIVLGVTASALLPRGADLVPAWAAFVLSIPFMTTLVPFALGLALLSGGGQPQDDADAAEVPVLARPLLTGTTP